MPTIKDIAKMANVSTATVSRIINGKGEASPETINRVMSIIKELNYKPNRLAQSLSMKKSDLIAVILPNLKNPFFGELVTAIEKSATNRGLRILLCNTDDSRSKVEYFLNTIADNYAFGTVICTLQVTSDDLVDLESKGIHTVTIDRAFFNHDYSSVNIDQYHGAYIATEHLIKKNAEKILFLSGPEDDPLSIERKKGYLNCLNNYKLSFNHTVFGDFTTENGYHVISNLIQEGCDFDAIYSSNDLMAIGAIRACRDHGICVPDRIKVIGNDNLSIDDYLEPRLTSLSQENEIVSDMVIEELIALRELKSSPKKQTIKPKIIIRETS